MNVFIFFLARHALFTAVSVVRIGHDIERDRQRYQVSESGIVVVEGGKRCETDCQESS